jgi:hypothetical protein
MNVDQEIAALRCLSLPELRGRFARLFGEESQTTNNRIWLIKRLAWRLQALAEGDLSQRARQRAAELADDANLRLGPPRPPRIAAGSRPIPTSSRPLRSHAALRPGTVLARPYKGQTLQVTALELGFQFEGVVYPSLSAVAKAITGSHCSGRLFFRLNGKGGAQ